MLQIGKLQADTTAQENRASIEGLKQQVHHLETVQAEMGSGLEAKVGAVQAALEEVRQEGGTQRAEIRSAAAEHRELTDQQFEQVQKQLSELPLLSPKDLAKIQGFSEEMEQLQGEIAEQGRTVQALKDAMTDMKTEAGPGFGWRLGFAL